MLRRMTQEGLNALRSKCLVNRSRTMRCSVRQMSSVPGGDGKEAGDEDDDLEEPEEMFVEGPSGGMEWGGPTRGGRHAEPTRFGDWERKGRTSDF